MEKKIVLMVTLVVGVFLIVHGMQNGSIVHDVVGGALVGFYGGVAK